MDAKALQSLGLKVRGGPETWVAELPLSPPLTNPLNQRAMDLAQLSATGERLMITSPAELVGLPSLQLDAHTTAAGLADRLRSEYTEYLSLVRHRQDRLQALGIRSELSPDTLVLSAELKVEQFLFTLVSDKRGNFRIGQVLEGGKLARSEFGQEFDITEMRDRPTLGNYLLSLVNAAGTHPGLASAARGQGPVRFEELFAKLGPAASVPARAPLEILIRLSVDGHEYRFVAARVDGRTFRGILAGPAGKLWAERFVLDTFPGAQALLAQVLTLPVERVTLLPPESE